MSPISHCLCLLLAAQLARAAPADGFVFPDERRREKKLEPVITPPVLPYLEHLERDPSTLLSSDTAIREKSLTRNRGPSSQQPLKPRHGFGGGFSVAPSGNGGLTASVSSSASGAGASQSASQSFSFGFDQGFSASQSASQASSFNGFGGGFSGSQASSQAASFSGSGHGGSSGSIAASSAAAFSHGSGGSSSGSQSASSAFGFNGFNNGFNSLNPPNDEVYFGNDQLDIRHRGVPGFPFPGRKGVGAAAVKTRRPSRGRSDDWLAVFVSD